MEEEGKDRRHMENLLLSEIGGSRGARKSLRMLEASDVNFSWILSMIHSLFIYTLLFFALSIYYTPWAENILIRMECMVDQLCTEIVLLGSTS